VSSRFRFLIEVWKTESTLFYNGGRRPTANHHNNYLFEIDGRLSVVNSKTIWLNTRIQNNLWSFFKRSAKTLHLFAPFDNIFSIV